ncbi:MAG: carboxylesterase family protein [Gammaproteobacteria bacterium]|nr:carboxylesterase family protein [Gammaproteobacteria bacterium]
MTTRFVTMCCVSEMHIFLRPFCRVVLLGLFGALASTLSATESDVTASNLLVQTAQGTLGGEISHSHPSVRSYKGIPYAAAPIGNLRWQAPQSAAAWPGTRDATEFGNRCVQPKIETGFYATDDQPMSEDCLFLNVWTSSPAPDAKQPVMVWIHGGAFIMGSGSESIYHGDALAQDGVVVVTINYRLGLYGFFAHPVLSKESSTDTSGNQGLQDQIAALKWVQENIAAFGGDAENVTIFGESAGSISVCYLVATPLAKGLFHKAIGQSGGCYQKHATLEEPGSEISFLGNAEQDNRAGYAIGREVAAALGAAGVSPDALEIMRSLSTTEISTKLLSAGVVMPWRSIFVDGYVFPKQMRMLHAQGQASNVDSLIGSTKDEGIMLFTDVEELSLDEWAASIRTNTPKYADQLIAAYDEDAQKSTKLAQQEMMSDAVFGAEMRTWAQLVESRNRNSYVYIFNHAPPIEGMGRNLGAFHGGEIQYVFQSHNGEANEDGLPALWDETDREVARLMRGYWVNFARTGNPNGNGLPIWPTYSVQTNRSMAIQANAQAVKDLRKAKFDVHEQIMRDGFAGAQTL